MAQLKDTTIDGNLSVNNNILLQTTKGIQGVHPETGDTSALLSMSNYGHTILGYDGYVNGSGNSNVYGNDVYLYVASAGRSNFRPYYRAGDSLDFNIKTAGYVTNSMADVSFLVPVTVPILGSPTATASSINGFILRQGNNYTHGSTASIYTTPISYSVNTYPAMGFVIIAKFDVTTNVTNNDAIGIYWSGNITLS